LSVITRSTVTPRRANQTSERSRKGHGAGLARVGQDLGVGEPGGIIDADMQELPATAALLAVPVAGDAVATPSIRPSFLTSMWSSSPGCSRW
jgi:hypothetical protein